MTFATRKESLRKTRDRFQEFSKKELGRTQSQLEGREEFNWEGWDSCARFGVMALPVDPIFGGEGAGMSRIIEALQGLGYGCRDNGLLLSINAHLWGCQLPVSTFGSNSLRKKYLPLLSSGKLVGAHAISEPEAGSDIFSLSTSARLDGDEYILNGTKTFVTNGTVADIVVVLARCKGKDGMGELSAFLLEKDCPGFKVDKKLGKMGLRTAEMAQLKLLECRIPKCNRIGDEGIGQALFGHVMEWERSCIMAPALGSMQAVLERTICHAKERIQFGKPISNQPEVARRIIQMKTRIQTASLLLKQVGELKDMGRSVLMEASLAKLYVSECWIQNCLDAMGVHGGYGYLTDVGIEKELRDAMGSQFYSGTPEIQRLTAAKLMGL